MLCTVSQLGEHLTKVSWNSIQWFWNYGRDTHCMTLTFDPTPVIWTLSQHSWNKGSAHCLNEVNIWPKFHEIQSSSLEVIEQIRNTWFKLSRQLVTLTLSQPCWNMGSAHCLDGMNIWLKFDKIHSRGSEDMNRTQNTWFKFSNTTGDLDLVPTRLEHGFCTSSS